ncbi:MAG: mannosyltransferase family protein [Acidimicrobiales bacterium]
MPGGAAEGGTAVADGRRGALVYLGIAAVLFVVSAVASVWLPNPGQQVIPPFPGWRWLQGWAQWDSGWYSAIAQGGYGYIPGRHSTIAFFPSYPLAMRAIAVVVGNTYVAGILVTVASGAVASRLFLGWLYARFTRPQAWAALGLMLVYPYAFFLYGAVYPTAFFVMTVVGAFVLLEHDHPWLAGMVGALATAARPTGVVLVVGLAVRAVERRRALAAEGAPARPLWRDAGVLLSGLGLAAFCLYQWRRFGDPFTFVTAQSAWDQETGLRTWLKVRFFEDLSTLPDRNPLASLSYLAHAVLTVGALALVPRVFRRFGYGYGTFALLMVLVPAVSTKNFFGMGRYLLAAFPCFAVAGELLAARPKLAAVVYPVSAIGLVALTVAYSQGHYLS